MPKLFCVIVGRVGSPFSVSIAADDTVDVLKDKIKSKKSQTITCEADHLELYLALKDGAGLSRADALAVTLGDLQNFKMMNETLRIENPKHFGENFKPNEGEIYVLVVVPSQKSVGELPLGFVDCKIGFYKDIFNADVKDGWLHFSHAIPSSKSQALLVLASYETIASSILEGGNDEIFKAIITGTPGIGKSLFLIYLLWNLVKAGKRVKRVLFVYHPDLIYFGGVGRVVELRELPPVVEHAFWDENLWCLFDAKGKNEEHLSSIPYTRCNVVLSTSPRRDMINDFKKPLLLLKSSTCRCGLSLNCNKSRKHFS
ncbi:hypothetical protein Ae201684P_020632 [Aphanomyces euteiches]|uniref:Crinkler effector protein N-terminal domain-containing protein n=1 Tax=Aphanomyces euteiches TaxID=100861 RepID=A0A6G0W5A4_9STRA|nr:hypothetical protein Ae201684_018572 [Aphanomyces euteiches]KAH9080053.1 hypothetical protein Ae201684P_020632 [Aphanomyces euteiches]